MVLWHSTLLDREETSSISIRLANNTTLIVLVESMMAPITKITRVTKKAKPVKKITRAAKQAESETAGEDAASMKSVLTALTAVLTTLTQKQDDQGRPGPRPERTVSFTEDELATPAPSTSQASPGPVLL